MSTHSLFPLSEYQGHKMSTESALILTESTSRRRSAAATQLCVFVYYGAAKVFRLSMWFKITQTRPEWRGKCVGNGCKFEVCIKQSQTYNRLTFGWALFVTYTIIQSIMRSEMCSLHLTHPSVHTWSSGQPTVQRTGSSRGLPVGAGIRTHNLGLPRVSSPTLYPLGQRLP